MNRHWQCQRWSRRVGTIAVSLLQPCCPGPPSTDNPNTNSARTRIPTSPRSAYGPTASKGLCIAQRRGIRSQHVVLARLHEADNFGGLLICVEPDAGNSRREPPTNRRFGELLRAPSPTRHGGRGEPVRTAREARRDAGRARPTAQRGARSRRARHGGVAGGLHGATGRPRGRRRAEVVRHRRHARRERVLGRLQRRRRGVLRRRRHRTGTWRAPPSTRASSAWHPPPTGVGTGSMPPTGASSPSVTQASSARPDPSYSTSPSSAWRPPMTGAATGSWPPTGGSSPSGTRPSRDRWAGTPSTSRSSAWSRPRTDGATGWSPPTGGSSPSATRPSRDRSGVARPESPIAYMAPAPDNQGYWLVSQDGTVYSFGDGQQLRVRQGIERSRHLHGGDTLGRRLLGPDGGRRGAPLRQGDELRLAGHRPGGRVHRDQWELEQRPHQRLDALQHRSIGKQHALRCRSRPLAVEWDGRRGRPPSRSRARASVEPLRSTSAPTPRPTSPSRHPRPSPPWRPSARAGGCQRGDAGWHVLPDRRRSVHLRAHRQPPITANGQNLEIGGVARPSSPAYNAYQLATDWGTNAGCGSMATTAQIDAFFASLRPDSLVRFWAFQETIGDQRPHGPAGLGTARRRLLRGRPVPRVPHPGRSAAKGPGVTGATGRTPPGTRGGSCDVYNSPTDSDGRGLTPLSYWDYMKDLVSRYADSPALGMWEPMSEAEASTCPAAFEPTNCEGHQTCPDEAVAATR